MKDKNERIDIIPGTDLKIVQDVSKFCYGVDAILLSSFAKIKSRDKVMDICSGNGIIALRLYGLKNPRELHAVEIQKEVVDIFNKSLQINKIDDLHIHNMDLKELPAKFEFESFDKLVINPPYMESGHALKNPNMALSIARHEVYCTLDDIMRVCGYLLKSNGKLFMIHRPSRLPDIFELARKYRLEVKRMQLVYPRKDKRANLVLLEFAKNASKELLVEEALYVYNEDGFYTDEINKIYKMER